MSTAESYIRDLDLTAHPEGGYFKETYRSTLCIPGSVLQEHADERNLLTAIYFLLKDDDYSAFHRLNSDEIWCFHDGAPLSIHVLSPDGQLNTLSLGLDFSAGQQAQLLIPANHWFAAEITLKNSFSIMSCFVAPGFDFADFELADSNTLGQEHPQHSELIHRLCHHSEM